MQLENSINRLLMILVCLVPFTFIPDFVDMFFFPKFVLLFGLAFLILLKWLLYEKNKQGQLQAFTWPVKFTMIYWALNGISLFFTMDLTRSIWGFSNGWNGFLVITCYCLVLVFAALYFELTEKRIQLLVMAGTGMALIAMLQFSRIIEDDVFTYPMHEHFSRAYGTLGNPNYLGAYLTVFLPIALYQFFQTRKYRYLGASALMYAALLASMTRGTWLGSIVAILILLVFFRKEPGFLKVALQFVGVFTAVTLAMDLLLGGMIVLRFLAIVISFLEFTGPGEVEDGAGFQRILLWRQGLVAITEHPWFGVGPGNMRYVFADIPDSYQIFGGAVNNTHNEYIHIAATTGIPSLIAFLLMILSTLRRAYLNLKNRPINVLFLAILIGYSVQAFFGNSMVSFSFIPWVMTGMAVAMNAPEPSTAGEIRAAGEISTADSGVFMDN